MECAGQFYFNCDAMGLSWWFVASDLILFQIETLPKIQRLGYPGIRAKKSSRIFAEGFFSPLAAQKNASV